MMGCLLAVTKSTYENGATLIIPGSHKWSPERIPKKEEAVPAELDVGDVLIFTGNVYHGGGANKSMYTHVHLKPLLFEKDN
jgi:ectoine hydroxylase-related dioxygenase (phytanoyl-CoA dioxygenase family)